MRKNEWIRISPIRLIDNEGKNLGIVETPDALRLAREKGLDLVEIAPQATPPVCRIMEYGKFRYQKSKQERKKRTHQKKTEVKGVRISLRISKHDLQTKAKQAEKFLEQEHKVRIDIILRGREKIMGELAKEKLREFVEFIGIDTKIDQEIRRGQRGFNIIVVKDGQNKDKKSNIKENQDYRQEKNNAPVS